MRAFRPRWGYDDTQVAGRVSSASLLYAVGVQVWGDSAHKYEDGAPLCEDVAQQRRAEAYGTSV